ncbi:hypothetical protein HMPREF9382_1428 [Streptococcus sanguinis SK115]|uniref:Uncharacterized protein n=1 Tax=Streptococcus sanguinis SK115 TaxID=888810 RepID=F0I9E4_STRSA|nr:hypothetical protein HMPREF9382_1428 [Streptococcus sanguinis SK115]
MLEVLGKNESRVSARQSALRIEKIENEAGEWERLLQFEDCSMLLPLSCFLLFFSFGDKNSTI